MQNNVPEFLQVIADATGGEIDSVSGPLSDGSGFATMSLPLPKDQWLYADHDNHPPAKLRFRDGDTHIMLITGKMATEGDAGLEAGRGVTITRAHFTDLIREAGRYAIRAATSNGKIVDFDPDALLQNLVMGFTGRGDCFELEPKSADQYRKIHEATCTHALDGGNHKWTTWMADSEDGIVGTGATETEAIMNLAEQQREEEK